MDWIEGRLSPADARRTAVHVRLCPACEAEVLELRALLGALDAERTEAPPAELAAWAARLPRALAPRPQSRPGLLRIVADSWGLLVAGLVPSPAMARAGGPRGRRRILLSGRSFDLDMEVDYAGRADPRRLHGQILPAEGPRRLWQGAEVQFRAAGSGGARTRVDRRGEFRLPRLHRGRYRVEVSGPGSFTSPLFEV